MKFDVKKAEHDYITDHSQSYRKLAEKYEVDYNTIMKYAQRNEWAKKRKEYQSKLVQKSVAKTMDKEADKLSTLRTATDTAIDVVEGFISQFAEESESKYRDFKDCITMLEKLTGLQRNLNGILTKQEEITLTREQDESGESGVVFIPPLIAEDSEMVVREDNNV